jgi:hypothetical protein
MQKTTSRTGQAGQDRKDRTAWTGFDSQKRTGRLGQLEKDSQDRTGGTRLSRQDFQDMRLYCTYILLKTLGFAPAERRWALKPGCLWCWREEKARIRAFFHSRSALLLYFAFFFLRALFSLRIRER